MNKNLKIEHIRLLEEQVERQRLNLSHSYYKSFYDWQRLFCSATLTHHECCLMCGNQTGKTRTGTTIDAIHLMGNYPEDWNGHKFEHPPTCWLLGYSMEKTRDILQTALFGTYNKDDGWAGGLVPKEKIIGQESAPGTPNAMRTVKVKHVNGVSQVQFWSYSQGQHALMGDKIDWFHIDEEPRDPLIRPQVLRGTINGDRGRGGRGIYTFTPENGRTELVVTFTDNRSPDQYYMQKGWDDAPHMTEEKCERMLKQFPAYQRNMRSKGDPMLGHGLIYGELSEEVVLCDPFEVPDFWKVITGIDFGDTHPQAIAKLAYDPDADIIYVTNSWRQSGVSANDAWGAVKDWAEGYPMAWPHDGLSGEKARADSTQIKNHYSRAGFKMLFEHSQWPPTIDSKGNAVSGGISVEAGIFDILDRARKGKFKIFRGQIQLMEEWRRYHRDENGKIVKIDDDMLCAVRYALMMLRHAVYNKQINKVKVRMPRPIAVMGIQ